MNSTQDQNHDANKIDQNDAEFEDPDQGSLPNREKYLENAATSYFINDFKVNDIPESNPLQGVISEFVKRRLNYVNHKSKKDHQ